MSTTTMRPASYWVELQKQWIERCGGDLSGYVANYGSVSDENHSGDGGEAIYAADIAVLRQYEARAEHERQRGEPATKRQRESRGARALTSLAHSIGLIERVSEEHRHRLGSDVYTLSEAARSLDEVREYISATLR
jgi:hypothetical protein